VPTCGLPFRRPDAAVSAGAATALLLVQLESRVSYRSPGPSCRRPRFRAWSRSRFGSPLSLLVGRQVGASGAARSELAGEWARRGGWVEVCFASVRCMPSGAMDRPRECVRLRAWRIAGPRPPWAAGRRSREDWRLRRQRSRRGVVLECSSRGGACRFSALRWLGRGRRPAARGGWSCRRGIGRGLVRGRARCLGIGIARAWRRSSPRPGPSSWRGRA
jgi:hypothetical protein